MDNQTKSQDAGEPSRDESLDSHSERTQQATWWLRPRVVVLACLGMLLIGSPLLVRGYRLSLVPQTAEPFDTQALLSFSLPNEQNAYVEFRQASAITKWIANEHRKELDDAMDGEWSDASDAVRKWLDDNRPALELWKKGAAKPDAQTPLGPRLDKAGVTGKEFRYQSPHRLVYLEALRLRAEGQPQEALELLLMGFRCSHHIGRRGEHIERLRGFGIEGTMTHGIVKWAQDPIVTSELLHQALVELEKLHQQEPPLSPSFQIEYLRILADIRSAVRREGDPAWDTKPHWQRMGELAYGVISEPEVSERCLKHVFRNRLSQVDKPVRQRTRQSGSHGYFEPDPSQPHLPQPSKLDEWINHAYFGESYIDSEALILPAARRLEARYALRKTVLALEMYRRQQGSYPETLASLAPDMLSEIPDDVLEKTPKPLKYRKDGDNARLWSVGDDGVDHGGDLEKYKDYGHILGPRKAEQRTD